jgi:hypothetical protein
LRPIPRRALLRGAVAGGSASVALPWLEAMLPRRARAQDLIAPDRFGVWFWGNGTRPDQWTPLTEGVGWIPSPELAPLAEFVDRLSVLSGFEIKTATHPHHSGMTGIMTGQKYQELGITRDTIVSTFAAQSVDQLAADWFSGQTPFRSVEIGVTTFRGTDEGSTFQHLSHNGPNNPNPSEYDAIALYERLFALPTDPERDLVRTSVLDAVDQAAARLHARVGVADRARLEQFQDSVRTLELRLAGGAGSCSASAPASSYPDVYGLEQIEEKNLAMSELLAVALACDLTRAFSVQWSTCGSGVIVWQVGATNSLHQTCHDEALPQPTVNAAVAFEMSNLATLLRLLRDTPEGDGTLLDHVSMLCTSELSDGWIHSNQEFPILIAGGGNGRLAPGTHYRAPLRNTSDAVLTALHGAGVLLPSFGASEGYSSSPVSELLVG